MNEANNRRVIFRRTVGALARYILIRTVTGKLPQKGCLLRFARYGPN
jgi:hypothetical protein